MFVNPVHFLQLYHTSFKPQAPLFLSRIIGNLGPSEAGFPLRNMSKDRTEWSTVFPVFRT